MAKAKSKLRVYINKEFLSNHGFSDAIRVFSKIDNQFRVYYSIEAYDSKILLSPVPQTVGDSNEEQQIEDYSSFEYLEGDHIDNWSIYVNNRSNHLANINYCDELYALMDLIGSPLEKK